MSFMGALGGALKGGVTGWVGSGFNPAGAIGGAVLGGVSGGMAKKKKVVNATAADPMMTPGITADRGRVTGLIDGGQDAVNASSRAAAEYALPAFKQTLQGISESDARRGISNGEVAQGYEANASNDFQNHIAQAIAANSQGLYNSRLGASQDLYGTDLDVQSGNLDRQTAAANSRRQAKSGLWGSLTGAAASLGGAYLANRGRSSGYRDPGYAGNV